MFNISIVQNFPNTRMFHMMEIKVSREIHRSQDGLHIGKKKTDERNELCCPLGTEWWNGFIVSLNENREIQLSSVGYFLALRRSLIALPCICYGCMKLSVHVQHVQISDRLLIQVVNLKWIACDLRRLWIGIKWRVYHFMSGKFDHREM